MESTEFSGRKWLLSDAAESFMMRTQQGKFVGRPPPKSSSAASEKFAPFWPALIILGLWCMFVASVNILANNVFEVAHNKPAKMSSVLHDDMVNFGPHLAVDDSAQTCARTQWSWHLWWSTDLQQHYVLHSVNLTLRWEYSDAFVFDVEVLLGNTTNRKSSILCAKKVLHVSVEAGELKHDYAVMAQCSAYVPARFLTIRVNPTGSSGVGSPIMALCDLKAYAFEDPSLSLTVNKPLSSARSHLNALVLPSAAPLLPQQKFDAELASGGITSPFYLSAQQTTDVPVETGKKQQSLQLPNVTGYDLAGNVVHGYNQQQQHPEQIYLLAGRSITNVGDATFTTANPSVAAAALSIAALAAANAANGNAQHASSNNNNAVSPHILQAVNDRRAAVAQLHNSLIESLQSQHQQQFHTALANNMVNNNNINFNSQHHQQNVNNAQQSADTYYSSPPQQPQRPDVRVHPSDTTTSNIEYNRALESDPRGSMPSRAAAAAGGQAAVQLFDATTTNSAADVSVRRHTQPESVVEVATTMDAARATASRAAVINVDSTTAVQTEDPNSILRYESMPTTKFTPPLTNNAAEAAENLIPEYNILHSRSGVFGGGVGENSASAVGRPKGVEDISASNGLIIAPFVGILIGIVTLVVLVAIGIGLHRYCNFG